MNMNNNALIAMDKSGSFRVYLAITTEMVEEARKNDIKIIPLCSFAKREFKLKKEYLDVLLKEEAVMGIIKSLENRRTYYNIDKNLAYGFLTRGCPNKCKWCIVPQKEGKITPYMDIEEIAINNRKNIILMDNNVLASDYGLQQIEKIVSMGVRVDFNQGLDARLVTDEIARLLARVKWMKRIRFGCDTPGQIAECERATALIDKYGYKGEYFFYCILLNDFKESFERVNYWKNKGGRFLPHCQPYRDLNNPHQIIPQWQKDLAGWADKKWIFRSCEFKDFIPRKGFKCSEYFYNN